MFRVDVDWGRRIDGDRVLRWGRVIEEVLVLNIEPITM